MLTYNNNNHTPRPIHIYLKGVCPQINGAYTGAISTSMLKSIGVKWALAGHSERREIFGETDDYINAQCVKIIDEGMSVMLCIGESLAEFEQDLAGSVCAVQLKKGLKGIKKEDLDRVAIAYEPVWAIGKFCLLVGEVVKRIYLYENGHNLSIFHNLTLWMIILYLLLTNKRNW